MVCGISARKLGTKHVIARVRDPEYLDQTAFLQETLGLSTIVNPEFECAKEISRILRFPAAVRVDAFSKGSVEIVELKIDVGSILDGMVLKDLPRVSGAKVLVCVVERGGEAFIPNGDFVLAAGDRLNVSGAAGELRKFFVSLRKYRKPVRSVLIMGGGRIAVYLTKLLEDCGMNVTIIERDPDQCALLCDLAPNAHIILGDGTRSDVLMEEGILSTDAFVALTGDDGDNIITSLYANHCNVPKIVSKVNREHYTEILERSGLDSIVAPKELVAQQLTGYVRAMSNTTSSSMETLHRLVDGKVEVLEFRVMESASCVEVPLKELKIQPNMLISAIIRSNGGSVIPDGNTVIHPGDHAVIVTAAGRLDSIDAITEGV